MESNNKKKPSNFLYNIISSYIPFPCTGKTPHNLQQTERPNQTSGRRMILVMKMLCTDVMG